MTQSITPEDKLTPSCRQALDHLRDRRSQTQVVVVDGDWAFVSIGKISVNSVNDVVDQERAHVFIRIPTDFPSDTRPYGLVTIPYLTRDGGKEIHREHRNHQHAKPLEDALNASDIGFWSYQWQNISSSDPEDLANAVEIVRSRFQKV